MQVNVSQLFGGICIYNTCSVVYTKKEIVPKPEQRPLILEDSSLIICKGFLNKSHNLEDN
jgi:hypothetical protein